MAELQRCPKCLGAKEYSSLGLIYFECDRCKGHGYIEIEPIARPIVDNAVIGKTTVRKRSRKPINTNLPILQV